METFGSGNTTTQAWFTDLLSEAIANGKIIVDITQCLGGNVTLGKYATSNHLVSCGVISGNDLTFECAIAKLMYVLARYQNNADAIEAYLAPICGEMTCY